jgi:hypothetical protein
MEETYLLTYHRVRIILITPIKYNFCLLVMCTCYPFCAISKCTYLPPRLSSVSVKPGTHYPHVTWAHVMLRVQLGYLTLNYGVHSHLCHSAYVMWSDVELWSAHMPARLLNFCCRTHFGRRDVCHVSQNVCANRNLRGVLACTSRLTKCVRQQKFKRRAGMWADQSSTSDHVT